MDLVTATCYDKRADRYSRLTVDSFCWPEQGPSQHKFHDTCSCAGACDRACCMPVCLREGFGFSPGSPPPHLYAWVRGLWSLSGLSTSSRLLQHNELPSLLALPPLPLLPPSLLLPGWPWLASPVAACHQGGGGVTTRHMPAQNS